MINIHEIRPGTGERVLVAVMPRRRDLDIARQQGWYRIPVARAPKRVGADYVAFYFTGAFPPDQRHKVIYYAPVTAYHLTKRRDLLPNEPTHPRAENEYYQIMLGPLQKLDHPIPSLKLRRLTFISTTLTHLFAAHEINDLWEREQRKKALWKALQDDDMEAEQQVTLYEQRVCYAVDFLVRKSGRSLAVLCGDPPAPAPVSTPSLHIDEALLADAAACVKEIRKALGRTEL